MVRNGIDLIYGYYEFINNKHYKFNTYNEDSAYGMRRFAQDKIKDELRC